MPKTSRPNPDLTSGKLKRVSQITESHCGPAVLEMLLSNLGLEVDQQALTKAAGATQTIAEYGVRVDELAKAVHHLFAQAQFWVKHQTTVTELQTLCQEYGYPVGVEWQNLFYDSEEEEYEDTEGENYDFGHYSIVKSVDIDNDEIVMIDPFEEFSKSDRYFSLDWFTERWWDFNRVEINGLVRQRKDDHTSFIVTQKGVYFPKTLGMQPL